MMGGAWFEKVLGADPTEDTAAQVAVKSLSRILGIEREPTRVVSKLQRRCIPQYTVGHAGRVEGARKALVDAGLPVSLTGSSYDGVGLNDTIVSARKHVESIVRD